MYSATIASLDPLIVVHFGDPARGPMAYFDV
jgi:hypothetical protein